MRESSPVPALPHVAFTASHISTENSGSVWVKVSGLYWYMNLVPCLDVHSSVSCLTIFVCSTASAIVCSLELLKTTVRNRQEVALYMCRITCLAPATASTVRWMRSALAGVRTCNYIRIGRKKIRGLVAYLDPDVIGNLLVLDQIANEQEVRVTGSRVGYLDLLDTRF